jgi:hypothetical protein
MATLLPSPQKSNRGHCFCTGCCLLVLELLKQRAALELECTFAANGFRYREWAYLTYMETPKTPPPKPRRLAVKLAIKLPKPTGGPRQPRLLAP